MLAAEPEALGQEVRAHLLTGAVPAIGLAGIDATLDPATGVFEEWWSVPPFNDEVKIWNLVGALAHRSSAREPSRSQAVASGTSADLTVAKAKLAGEGCERTALGLAGEANLRLSSYDALTAAGERALSPVDVLIGSETRDERRQHESEIVTWELGVDLRTSASTWVPAQLVGVPHRFVDRETVWRAPVSTGGAAHASAGEAAWRGFRECVERDAFSLAWYAARVLVDTTKWALEAGALESYWPKLMRYGFSLRLFELPTDLPLHVQMAVIEDPIVTGRGARFVVSAAAAPDPLGAARSAVEEALMLRPYLRRLAEESQSISEVAADDIETRAKIWLEPSSHSVLAGWLAHAHAGQPEHKPTPATFGDLLEEIDVDVLYVPLEKYLPAAARDLGWKVGKVLVPQLQPLNLTDSCTDFAVDRLRAAGLVDLASIQTHPHPFL